MAKILLEEMTWQEFKEAVLKNIIIILPVGSVEQHGPHLPLGTDTYIPLEIAKKVAEKVNAIVAPPLFYGYKSRPRSGGGSLFPGTTSLSGITLICIIRDIIKEFIRQGLKRIIILNWHYENMSFLPEGVELALEENKDKSVKVIILDSPVDLISKDVLAKIFPETFPGWEIEHAAITETSLIQLIRPELVRKEKIRDDEAPRNPRYEIIPPPKDIVPKTGIFYKATLASKQKGELIFNELVEKIVEVVKSEFE